MPSWQLSFVWPRSNTRKMTHFLGAHIGPTNTDAPLLSRELDVLEWSKAPTTEIISMAPTTPKEVHCGLKSALARLLESQV